MTFIVNNNFKAKRIRRSVRSMGNRSYFRAPRPGEIDFRKRINGKTNRLYRCWYDMIRRCSPGNRKEQQRYYYSGIRVCTAWADWPTFARWAYKFGYSEELELDRIDNLGHYCPGNCRWSTEIIQSRNQKRNNRPILCHQTGEIYDMPAIAAEKLGIDGSGIRSMLCGAFKSTKGYTFEYVNNLKLEDRDSLKA